MKRRQVSSSTIKSTGYDPGRGILEIEFTSGEVYRYHEVPPYHFAGLLNAPSKGKYYNKYIKEFYSFSGPL
ncbi:MAG: KTSC domain-containing protein [Sphingobacteriales bacterium]|nr:MAG: KTSC domain-containing protein [Sphingobacteriales bacterium]